MLVYYLVNQGEKFENQDLNLSSELEIHYDTKEKELIINKNEDYIEGLFGEHIETVSALIGRNGAGKSSLLEYIRDRYFRGLASTEKSILMIKNENNYELFYNEELFPEETIKVNGIDYVIHNLLAEIILANGLQINVKKIKSKEINNLFIVQKTRLANDHAMVYFDNNWSFSIRERELDQEANTKGYEYHDFSVGNTLDTVLRDKFVMPSRISNPEDVFDITFDTRFELDYLHRVKVNDIKQVLSYLKEEKNRTYLKQFLEVPKHMYILYDYMNSDRRANNFLYHDEEVLLRYEKKDIAYLVEQTIYEELLQKNQEQISLYNTMILRIVESYFTDIDLMIPYEKIRLALRELESGKEKIHEKELLVKITHFCGNALEAITSYIPAKNEVQINKEILKNRVLKLTQGYVKFIDFINSNMSHLTNCENVEVNTSTSGAIIKQKIEIPKVELDDDGLDFMLEFIERFENTGSNSNFLHFNWHNLSSGEENLLKLLAKISYVIEKISQKNLIILLDEAETTYHPEWQRKYIQILTSNIEQIAARKSKKIQIIMTTHSPVITSDIPHYAINYIVKENEEHKIMASQEPTLGSNIHSLYLNNFYLDSTMGQFVKEKIDGILQKLNKSSKSITSVELEEINQFVKLIGDPIIRKVLTELILKKVLQEKDVESRHRATLENLKLMQELINQQITSFEQERRPDE